MRRFASFLVVPALLVLSPSVLADPVVAPETGDVQPVGGDPLATNYAGAPAWRSACVGDPFTRQDVDGLLGDRPALPLGRFEIALCDACNPWVSGLRSCGPSGESIEAANGTKRFEFGLERWSVPSMGSWRFTFGTLSFHERGTVLARRIGPRVVVQLVGDVSGVQVATGLDLANRPTGTTLLRGRLLSSDVLEAPGGLVTLAAAIDEGRAKIGATDVDIALTRWTTPNLPVVTPQVRANASGRDVWSRAGSGLRGSLTKSCLRLSDGCRRRRSSSRPRSTHFPDDPRFARDLHSRSCANISVTHTLPSASSRTAMPAPSNDFLRRFVRCEGLA